GSDAPPDRRDDTATTLMTTTAAAAAAIRVAPPRRSHDPAWPGVFEDDSPCDALDTTCASPVVVGDAAGLCVGGVAGNATARSLTRSDPEVVSGRVVAA